MRRKPISWMVRRALAVASGLCLSAVPVRAQSEATVRGQVVAAADGTAVSQAEIRLSGVTIPRGEGPFGVDAVSDGGGRFTLGPVRPGGYELAVSAPGFATRLVRFDLEPRELKALTVRLELQRVTVSVGVSGEPPSLPSAHSPSSTVLTRDRLDALPPTARTSLPDAIVTAAPGMIRGHDDFVHVRGEEVALNPLINGVAFWENSHAVFSAGLSPDVIESANVMTGGFSAEYGNRFGGVLDIVTKSGLEMANTGAVTLNGGQAGRRSGSGEFGGHRGRTGYYLFGSIFESDRFLSPPDPEAIHDRGTGGHLFLQLDRSLGRGGALRGVVMGDAANFEIPRTPDDLILRPLAGASQRTRQQTAILGWTRMWPETAVSASFYQRWSRSRLLPAAGPLTAQARLTRDLATIGGKVDVTRFAGRHAFKAGLDAVRLRPDEALAYSYGGYRELTHLLGLPHVHITDNTIEYAGREAGGQVSAYVQDTVRLGNRATADAGVRVDRYGLLETTTHASPRVNLAVQAGGGTVVHASWNHFFVPPPIEGVLSSGAGLTARIREIGVALPRVQPTTEDQFELGASVPAGPLRLGLTGYHRASDNPVHTTVWPDARIYSYASFDRALAYGLEARAEVPGLDRHGWTGYLNYALGRVYFYNPVSGGFVTEAEHLDATDRFLAPMDQTHTLTAGATYRHARSGLWAGGAFEYGSGTPMEHGGGEDAHAPGEAAHEHATSAAGAPRVPGHATMNLSLGVDLLRRDTRRAKLTLRLDIENITDNPYLIAQEGEFSPGQYSVPRLVAVTARVRF